MTRDATETEGTITEVSSTARDTAAMPTAGDAHGATSNTRQMGLWRLDSPLGRGAQGRTYRAVHVQTGAIAALKVLDVAELADWKPYDLFDRERAALESLSHPGIPLFLEAGTTDGRRWIAMQLMEGEPLSERLRQGHGLSNERIEDLLDQALDVLAYLHGVSPPIIHRDIKPSNLVVSPSGRLALVDFGSVRTAFRADGGSTMAGTFGYLAPEQLHGEATAKTDLYSLGVSMLALAAGVEGRELPRKGIRVDIGRIPVDGPLKAALTAMTDPDPDLRPASAELARALLHPASSDSAAATDDTSHRTNNNPFSAVFWLLVSLVVVVFSTLFKVVTHLVTRQHDRQRARLEAKTRKELARLDDKQNRQKARLSKVRDTLTNLELKASERRKNILPQQRPPRNPPRR
jgi:serine/threonine protein kinase